MGAPIPPGCYGLGKEIAIATFLGTAGLIGFKMWHVGERKKMSDYYAALEKKQAATQ
eukprot:CAMPEP_0114244276 /NCGR_PEP_ID=MMETSP0058-20121206/11249_1 /TAXON_ID=36894 /ORGANISM="Pyramimonas parkeae, CCMP726" /LENGTH=56 /DNA_ID=CAMNT_0001357197 /DNA_START=175 /DNA_END=345 /DNA_ORIENTATION=+